ncbi:MAG: ATP-grasp domain-containing protein [Thermoproteota archaeon]|nr:ATP-grasp domain-containing protein [Candidatus Brockarchaeota archaeon]MBO3768251.1 ATP-grasp domain-containing protein [Candidatus Brockarchaeota archaeon]MBO3801266.1 ATP-grasp domain-containing protein [Candidatus Brockarchaeota archaeon]
MSFCILTHKPKSHFVVNVSNSFRKKGYAVSVVDFKNVAVKIEKNNISVFDKKSGKDLLKFDAVLARPMEAIDLMLFAFSINVLFILKESKVPVVNDPISYVYGSNKLTEYILLTRMNLSIPTTFSAINEVNPFIYINQDRLILKPICGSRGFGVMEIKRREKFHLSKNEVPIFQNFVRGGNFDIRLLVVNKNVVSSMIRFSTSSRTNISTGGKPMKYEAPEEIKKLAIDASVAIHSSIAGVDVAIDKDGTPYILEVNTQPDFIGLQSVSDINIADAIVDGFLEAVKL